MSWSIKKLNDLFVLNTLHILNDGFIVSLPLLLPFIKTDLNLNLTQVGFLGSMLYLLGVFLALPSGIIAQKFGGLKSLTWAMGLYSLGFIITSFSPYYWLIVVAFIIAGSGFGIFHPIAFATVANLTQKSGRGKAMGYFTAVGDLGRVGISAGVTAIAAFIGWRLTSGIYGAIGLGLFILLILIKKYDSIQFDKQSNKSVPIKYFLKHKSFLLVTLTAALDTFSSSSLYVFIPFLLLSKGISPAVIGTFTGFYFIGNFFGKSMMGRFVDVFGNTKVFVCAEFLMASMMMLFTLDSHWVITIAIAVLLGTLTKGTLPVIQTMLAEVTEKDQAYQKVFALNALTTSVSAAVAPLLFGVIADSFGIKNVFSVSAVFALLALITALILNEVEAKKRLVFLKNERI